jgi:hypothetical protein
MPSRYVSRKVQRQLRQISRDRCCISGDLISFREISLELEGDALHKHHIIYFSEGGENTVENLLVICPNCHVKIHDHPDLYPPETLKEAKRHWAQMKQLVPRHLFYEPDDLTTPDSDAEVISVKFYVAALNLKYKITVPLTVKIGSLSRFIATWIMHPLVTFAGLAPHRFLFGQAKLRGLKLALLSDSRDLLSELKAEPLLLPSTKSLSDLTIRPQDKLIALVDFQSVAAIYNPHLPATITLSWSEKPQDLDLHLILIETTLNPLVCTRLLSRSTEEHIFYGNVGTRSAFPWAQLDSDVRTGYGPEVISIDANARGRFIVFVHNFSAEWPLSRSEASVRIDFGTKQSLFRCPHMGDGLFWIVCIIDCDTCSIEMIDRLADTLDIGLQ